MCYDRIMFVINMFFCAFIHKDVYKIDSTSYARVIYQNNIHIFSLGRSFNVKYYFIKTIQSLQNVKVVIILFSKDQKYQATYYKNFLQNSIEFLHKFYLIITKECEHENACL